MTERLLQYIWQFQLFNKSELETAEGEPLQIIQSGTFNHNQGPDFLDAQCRIGNTLWAGNIELHVQASQWRVHGHSEDRNYNNVILHVVWQQDTDLQLPFPVLILEDRVPKILLNKYDELMNAGGFIPCEKNISRVDQLTWISWKECKEAIKSALKKNNNHWEETCWWLLAKQFGIKVNAEDFEAIARSLPLGVLAKHRSQVIQVEALLFGQAGLLVGDFSESYPKMLQREFHFLKRKYRIVQPSVSLHFLRMRPSNFPTIRLAQLAMLIHKSSQLFSKFLEAESVADLRSLFDITANDYWHYHYVFEETSGYKEKKLGRQMTDALIINAVVPLVFSYGLHHKIENCRQKALHWLEAIKPEKNSITDGFESISIPIQHAFDSQALLQLKNEYCNKKRCLDCRIGNKLVRNDQAFTTGN